MDISETTAMWLLWGKTHYHVTEDVFRVIGSLVSPLENITNQYEDLLSNVTNVKTGHTPKVHMVSLVYITHSKIQMPVVIVVIF